MGDTQEIYAILLGRGYQEELFSDLPGKRKREKAGKETLVDCPFCGKEGHFSYSSQQPLWQCWVCGEGGDWISYLEKAKRLDFREALSLLADRAGVEVQGLDRASYQSYTKRASLLEAAQALFVKALQSEEGGAVLDYCLARGYSVQEQQAMELGAYVSRDGLQEALQQAGYSEQEIKQSGLLTKGLGDTHQLTLLWRDPAGRAIGLAARSTLSREELKAKGLPPYMNTKGLKKSQGLVGLEAGRGAEELILVEGPLDALYLNSLGLQAVAQGGTSLSEAQIRALQSNGTKELLLALDRDEEGQKATDKAIQSLRSSQIRPYVVTLPDGHKDPDELVRAKGLEAFQEALQQAEGWPKWLARWILSRYDLQTDRGLDQALEAALTEYAGIEDKIQAREFWDALRASTGLSEEDLASRAREVERKFSQRRSGELLQATIRQVQAKTAEGDVFGAEQALSEGLQQLRSSRGVAAPEPYLLEDLEADLLASSEGLTTGYEGLDRLVRIPQGAITIIAGRPGHGKTTLLLNLLLKQVELYPDRAFYFFSYEEARKFLALKLVMIMAGVEINSEFNQGAYLNYFQEKRGSNEKIEKAISRYEEYTSSGRLLISDAMPRAEDLASTIGYLARRGEIGAVYVDYIQKISLQRPMPQRYLEIKLVSQLLLEEAVSNDLAIVLGCQLGRDKSSASKVKLDNLRESGDIEQDASLVLGLWNEAEEKRQDEGLEAIDREEVDLQVDVLKQRGGVAGRPTHLTFDRPILRIKDKSSSAAGLY